jgi:hypothetical protein
VRRSPLACALLLIPSLAVAGPLEAAHRLTEEARHNLQTIDQALAAAQIAGRRAVQDLEAAQARQRALPAQINATNRTIANFQGQLDAAAKLLPLATRFMHQIAPSVVATLIAAGLISGYNHTFSAHVQQPRMAALHAGEDAAAAPAPVKSVAPPATSTTEGTAMEKAPEIT